MGEGIVGPRGLARHFDEEIVTNSNIRGRLVFAIKKESGKLIEIEDGSGVGLKHDYPKDLCRDFYLKTYRVKLL